MIKLVWSDLLLEQKNFFQFDIDEYRLLSSTIQVTTVLHLNFYDSYTMFLFITFLIMKEEYHTCSSSLRENLILDIE